MRTRSLRLMRVLFIAVTFIVLTVAGVVAEEKRDMQGWGIDDPYNQHYDVKEFEKVRVWVIRVVEVVPMPGMSPGTAVFVQD